MFGSTARRSSAGQTCYALRVEFLPPTEVTIFTSMRILPGWFRTASDSIKYEGISILCWRILAKAVSPFADVHTQMLFDFDLTKPVEQREARIECRVEQATEADLDALVDQRMTRVPADDGEELTDEEEYRRAWLRRERARLRDAYRRWFRAGELCFVARIGDEIAHNNWIHFHGCKPLSSRPIYLAPGEAYAAEGFTTARWRGKRIHEAVNAYMLEYARTHGCHLAYTITDITKAGARRGVLRVGWRKRGQHLTVSPRRIAKSWMFRINGDVTPIVREVQGGRSFG
jgi:hypothetical protein